MPGVTAVTIFGGLVSATLLDAILTPLLFLAGLLDAEKARAEAALERAMEAYYRTPITGDHDDDA